MLLIITEGLDDEFEKVKSKRSPKSSARNISSMAENAMITVRLFSEYTTAIEWTS